MIKAIAVDKPELTQLVREIEEAKKEFIDLPVTIKLSDKIESCICGSACRHDDKFLNQNIEEQNNGK